MNHASVLKLGASVGHQAGGVGSLGFFARRRSDNALGFVSCNHVIAMIDRGNDGDAIVSPSIIDGGGNVIAALDGDYPRLGAAERVIADCAFAVLREGAPYDASTVEGGSLVSEPATLAAGLRVSKAGKSTNARPGIVENLNVGDVYIRYGMFRAAFDDVIMIGSAGDESFCAYGDSGALVYTIDTFQPVGLIFATAYVGGPHNLGWTWVHPINRVLKALDVRFVNR